MYIYGQEVFLFSNKIYKKACNIFKNGCKNCFQYTTCNEKNCLKRITLLKKIVCKSQKW